MRPPTKGFQYVEIRLQMLRTEEGGRRTPFVPILTSSTVYMPHIRTSPEGEHLGIVFVDGPAEIGPGDEATACAALMYHPMVDYSTVQADAEFELLEGDRVFGTGRVLRRWTSDDDWRDLRSE